MLLGDRSRESKESSSEFLGGDRKRERKKERKKQRKERPRRALFVVCGYYHDEQRGRPPWRLSVSLGAVDTNPDTIKDQVSYLKILTSLFLHSSLFYISLCRPSPSESIPSPKCRDAIREGESVGHELQTRGANCG